MTLAARLGAHGGPVRVEDVALPAPGDGEAVVDLAFAGINPVDRYGIEGRVAADGPLPRTLGAEASGHLEGRPVVVFGACLGAARDGVWA
jgi:NADPH:quinone reductase-like Zn-dependent oxidoreductase